MLKIGITGSIGSGKSTVAHIFEVLGVAVYYADIRAKELMSASEEIRQKVIQLFGKEAYFENGNLNRKHIAQIAFSNAAMLQQLNKTVHPIVFADFDTWCLEHQHAPYIVKEAALMFETDSYLSLNKIITVTSPEHIRIERVKQRDGIDEQAIRERMKQQFTQEEKLKRSDYEIRNNETEFLIPQVLALHQKFVSDNLS
jgi:dephospho-CoA kinase